MNASVNYSHERGAVDDDGQHVQDYLFAHVAGDLTWKV